MKVPTNCNTPEALAALVSIKHLVFDMDGTIYLGERVLPGAADALRRLARSGRDISFFTNNTSKSIEDYFTKLNSLGFDAAHERIDSAADVTIDYIKSAHPGRSVFLLGTPSLAAAFENAGIELFTDEKAEPAGSDTYSLPAALPGLVVTGFDLTLTYRRLERACRFIHGGIPWISTHPDINCPIDGGFIPDCGAINKLISVSTGKQPEVFGKPYSQTVNFLEKRYGIPRQNMAIIGDRLYTDIALGKASGMLAVLVLTGEASLGEALALPSEKRPDLIFKSVKEMTEMILKDGLIC